LLGHNLPLIISELSHSNIQRHDGRLGCLDSYQGAQIVEAPRGPDIKVVQDGWIFELNLLDVVIEVQRDPRAARFRCQQAGSSEARWLARALARMMSGFA